MQSKAKIEKNVVLVTKAFCFFNFFFLLQTPFCVFKIKKQTQWAELKRRKNQTKKRKKRIYGIKERQKTNKSKNKMTNKKEQMTLTNKNRR